MEPLRTIDGKYELIRQLGEGGMGAVYEARNRGTGRRVAVKVIVGEALAKSQEVVARFQKEAMATGAIEFSTLRRFSIPASTRRARVPTW